MKTKALFLIAALATLVASTQSRAATFTIDSESGSVYDAIIDGFPGVYTFDGMPDAGSNALSVALKPGVTEMRAIAEMPLADLAGLTSADIVSATLTFNIDDVIGTFGPPPTNFDGTASENIILWAWNGNGTVDLADFNNVIGAPTAVVNTGPHGSITDATLMTSGPLTFSINVTAALGARLDGAATHMGITFATNDNNTATSIDNLGVNAGGPAGVGGAAFPYLTVVTVEAAPPVFDTAERKCQKAISAGAAKYAAAAHKLLNQCFERVLKDVAESEPLAEAIIYCAERLDPTAVEPSKVAKVRTKAEESILDKCEAPLTPASINSPCDAGAADFADVAQCVLDGAGERTQQTVNATYANACAILTAVGFEVDYPAVCAVP